MKTLTLLGACIIAGAVRYPIEGPQTVQDEEAERLIETGLAKLENVDEDKAEDDLDGLEDLTMPDLGLLVTKEGVALNGATKKDDIIAAIRAHRASKA